MSRILVVDDEPGLTRAVVINLRAHGFETDAAPDGRTALRLVAQCHPDAVLLDLGLPDINGMEVLAGIRGWSAMPVVILSARDDVAGKVAALDAGADDYITKPFSMAELLARVRAVLRRPTDGDGDRLVSNPAFTVDFSTRKATNTGGPVHLTPTEWRLLEALARHPGRLVTQSALLLSVWGPGATDPRYLRVYVAALRRKLEPGATARHLVTEPGVGYRLEP